MSSIEELALAGLASRLATIAGVTVERDRHDPVAVYPTLIVPAEAERVDQVALPLADDEIAVRVEGFVQAADPASAEIAAHLLYAQALQAIAADPGLGGAALDTTEIMLDLTHDEATASKPTAAFTLELAIRTWSSLTDPGASAP